MEKTDLATANRTSKQPSHHLFNLLPRFKERSLNLRNLRSLLQFDSLMTLENHNVRVLRLVRQKRVVLVCSATEYHFFFLQAVTGPSPLSKGNAANENNVFYSGPEGARVKVSPLLFLIICHVLNFLSGYKA